MKRYVLLLLLFISFSGYAQNTINNYKYVIVPQKFSFLKQSDQYRLNSLTKILLQEKGFTTYFDNEELPKEIANNKCNALNADVTEKKGMFTTTLTLLLKDCQGNVVFKSKEGKSREKDFKTSYTLALKEAFTSLNEVEYVYNGATNITSQQPVPPAVATIPVTQTAPVQNQSPEKAIVAEQTQSTGTLYAQATSNGYQLIDTTPKKVLTLFKTSQQDYFIANNETVNGLVFKKNGDWFFEYYKNGSLTAEKLQIKF